MSQLIQQHVLLQEAIDTAISGIGDFESLAHEVLTRVVIETINKYQQKLNVGIQDSASDLLDNFKSQIKESIFEKANQWKIANRGSFLFPRGCRFCFTKGKSTIFVVEQEPQIRSIMINSGIIADRLVETTNFQRMALSLPFVIFVVHFVEGRLANVYCVWRTSQLKDMNDPLFKCLLPNIHTTGSICLGDSWNTQSTSMAGITQDVINYYWNSRFNNDLSNDWWLKGNADPKLKNAIKWCENTLEDPSFILDVSIPPFDKTLQGLIDVILVSEEAPDENALKHQISEDIDRYVSGLFSKMMKYFKNTKFDKLHPKDVTETLQSALKKTSSDLNDLIFVIQNEVQKLKKSIPKSNSKLQPVGPLWANYQA